MLRDFVRLSFRLWRSWHYDFGPLPVYAIAHLAFNQYSLSFNNFANINRLIIINHDSRLPCPRQSRFRTGLEFKITRTFTYETCA